MTGDLEGLSPSGTFMGMHGHDRSAAAKPRSSAFPLIAAPILPASARTRDRQPFDGSQASFDLLHGLSALGIVCFDVNTITAARCRLHDRLSCRSCDALWSQSHRQGADVFVAVQE
jgi:hypothetical protein